MTMRVEILRGFCIGQGQDVQPGDLVEFDDARARLLIAQGKARLPAAPEPAAPADEPKKATRSKRNV